MITCAIVDYGMGNLLSVANAIRFLGYHAVPIDTPGGLARADVIVLPGVGAFGKAMDNLRATGLIDAMEREVLAAGKPFLGICLGMQLLAGASREEGRHAGLGWIAGDVDLLRDDDPRVRVPHVGWSTVEPGPAGTLLRDLPADTCFYFDHSYALSCDPAIVAATCGFGERRVVCAIEKDNIFATQFHPEKSQTAGLKLLRRFFRRVERVPVDVAA